MAERVFAFTGKGGVGKTSLSALTVRLLAKRHPEKKILAIDADPAVGLSTALGVGVTQTLNDVRLRFIDELKEKKGISAAAVLHEAQYELMNTVTDCGEYCFLAIGRPEGAGCYCSVNNFLRDLVAELVDNFDYVVIDGEAGIEQVNRRVMQTVTDLMLVSDSSRKGIEVVHTIRRVAKGLNMFNREYLILNRVRNEQLLSMIDTGDLEISCALPEDVQLELLDIQGESLFSLSEQSQTLQRLTGLYERAGV